MITPKQAKEMAKPDKGTIKRLEDKIDAAIIAETRSGHKSITIEAKIFPDEASKELIMSMYRANGWVVQYESDQRDGSYVRFSEYTGGCIGSFYDR